MRVYKKDKTMRFLLAMGLLAAWSVSAPTAARGQETAGSLASVTGESTILPGSDASGCYLLKSDGFYCLKEDGGLDTAPAVHYFDHVTIGGTVFDGFYYHDESGKFKAARPQMQYLKGVEAVLSGEQAQLFAAAQDAETEGDEAADADAETGDTCRLSYDGYYMIGNLGRLNAAPQVRYINSLTFRGFYYFDETGKMDTEPGIHSLDMVCNGIRFDGSYYFGGENGALLMEAAVTEEGYVTDASGKVQNADESGIARLEPVLTEKLSAYEGTWSVYVKDLKEGGELLLNDTPLSSASLIKTFVMAGTYDNLQTVRENLAAQLKTDADSAAVTKKLNTLLENMIAFSDNESYNEMVRLQTDAGTFSAGARKLNRYLKQSGFSETQVLHTLAPSKTAPTGIGESNITTVKECGRLLEQIYSGECVSADASAAMLDLLLEQSNRTKIPTGIPEEASVANKTGETDASEHDIAIVYGEKTDFILCVMSENSPEEEDAVQIIREIANLTYRYLNS